MDKEAPLAVQPSREELAVIQNVASHVVMKLKMDYDEPLRYMEEEDLRQELVIVGLKQYPKWNGRGKKFKDVYEGGYEKGQKSLRMFTLKVLMLHTYKVVYLGKMDKRIANFLPELTDRLDEPVEFQNGFTVTKADLLLEPTMEDPEMGEVQRVLTEYDLPMREFRVAMGISIYGLGSDGVTQAQLSDKIGIPLKEVKKAITKLRKNVQLHEALLELRK